MKKVMPIHEIVLGLGVQKSWPKVFSSKVFMRFHADSTYEDEEKNKEFIRAKGMNFKVQGLVLKFGTKLSYKLIQSF